jgi:hypothetical protein
MGMQKLFGDIADDERQVLIVLLDIAIALLSAGLVVEVLKGLC